MVGGYFLFSSLGEYPTGAPAWGTTIKYTTTAVLLQGDSTTQCNGNEATYRLLVAAAVSLNETGRVPVGFKFVFQHFYDHFTYYWYQVRAKYAQVSYVHIPNTTTTNMHVYIRASTL